MVSVTRGAIQSLTRDELQGVIGHEFSHILNGDMRLNLRLMGLIFGILCLAVIGRVLLQTRGREHIRARPDRGLETRHVVAKRRAEAARLQKIALHIDDDEGRPAGIDRNRRRLRFYRPYCHGTFRLPDRCLPLGSKIGASSPDFLFGGAGQKRTGQRAPAWQFQQD